MRTDNQLIEQIERVLLKFPPVVNSWQVGTLSSFRDTVGYSSLKTECLALAGYVYGQDHPQTQALKGIFRQATLHHLKLAEGLLRGTIEAINHGLLIELRSQVLLDIKNDFIEAARSALANDSVEVAAVLASAVLEDSLKRLAGNESLDHLLDKEFSVVVTGLLKEDKISKGTKGILLGYKDLRNAALHAQWKEVTKESVSSLIMYLPQFMEQHRV